MWRGRPRRVTRSTQSVILSEDCSLREKRKGQPQSKDPYLQQYAVPNASPVILDLRSYRGRAAL